MIVDGEVKSTCGICFNNCGVLIQVANGRAAKIKGDPQSPVNKGRLCKKGLASLEYLHSPHRLKYPLKRIGEKGSGKWGRISWDEALSVVADEMIKAKEDHGPETVAFIDGSAKGLQEAVLRRFVNAFGSPNMISTDHICFVPRKSASVLTYGFYSLPDYDYPLACIQLGNAVDQNLNSFQTARAVSVLRSITGNLGRPGGELEKSSLSGKVELYSERLKERGFDPLPIYRKLVLTDDKPPYNHEMGSSNLRGILCRVYKQ